MQHTRQQAVYHTSALKMNAGHVLCLQSRMKQLDSGLSQITVEHIAHECLINQTYRSFTFHCKQTREAYAVIQHDASSMLEAVSMGLLCASVGRLQLDIIRSDKRNDSKYFKFYIVPCDHFSNILLSFYVSSVFSLCHFSDQLYCIMW